ncbi:MAG: hypothetical protein GY835_15100 [bacterium]|nr:hypothetical protein [bacterium]
MQIQSIPGKMESIWHNEAKAVIDTWTKYSVTLDEFKKAVQDKGLSFGKARNVQAWIVDSSQASGAFSQEIQEFIGTELFPAFAENGVKYFITITSDSAITKMSVSSYSAKAGPSGLQLVEVASVQDAVEWLKLNAGAGSPA